MQLIVETFWQAGEPSHAVAGTQLGWAPGGLPEGVQAALAVPVGTTQVVSRALYMGLLIAKLDALIQADHLAARRVMEVSEEHCPELYGITMYCGRTIRLAPSCVGIASRRS